VHGRRLRGAHSFHGRPPELMVARRTVLKGAVAVAAAGAAGVAAREWWLDREPPSPPVQDAAGRLVWSNWSGHQYAYPAERAAPQSEEHVVDLLTRAPAPIRPAGAGHSLTRL